MEKLKVKGHKKIVQMLSEQSWYSHLILDEVEFKQKMTRDRVI